MRASLFCLLKSWKKEVCNFSVHGKKNQGLCLDILHIPLESCHTILLLFKFSVILGEFREPHLHTDCDMESTSDRNCASAPEIQSQLCACVCHHRHCRWKLPRVLPSRAVIQDVFVNLQFKIKKDECWSRLSSHIPGIAEKLKNQSQLNWIKILLWWT